MFIAIFFLHWEILWLPPPKPKLGTARPERNKIKVESVVNPKVTAGLFGPSMEQVLKVHFVTSGD